MAIEIKELVLRVSVNKSIQQAQDQYVTKHELSKNRKAMTDEILRKVETMLRDAAERR
jgi:hypothetical protein